ncbi:metallophosphoesterase family protein [Leeuwenhoekiella parthenopeia]|uniref:Serine/threonine protein phosphatase n=1 Tax=Leeuwenhoekiella parthenopeia TaxID=2890320 RepID=A0ABS8GPE6_9FLAO|nr:metallophosphoesterase family protein [Leeuwenhoekiella parthenopeia]MCC4211847.1 serine/threonine protein phosphatase [Leeuwenhoekiella parthenopeia]
MARTLAIGDIHGGLKGLKQILERAAVQPDDLLVFLGDYVDGWSDSAQTIDFLIDLKTRQNCIFIRGNHDELVSDWLKTHKTNETWLNHGGISSIRSYQSYSEAQRKEHLEFYEALENYHIDAANRMYVHAGFQNHNGPEYEHHSTAFYWDRTFWEMAVGLDKSLKPDDLEYPKRLTHHKEIFIGHTPVTRINRDEPTQMANVWNVDTGAAFYGKLSILDVDTKEFWQSDPLYKLYPDEDGRNA